MPSLTKKKFVALQLDRKPPGSSINASSAPLNFGDTLQQASDGTLTKETAEQAANYLWRRFVSHFEM